MRESMTSTQRISSLHLFYGVIGEVIVNIAVNFEHVTTLRSSKFVNIIDRVIYPLLRISSCRYALIHQLVEYDILTNLPRHDKLPSDYF